MVAWVKNGMKIQTINLLLVERGWSVYNVKIMRGLIGELQITLLLYLVGEWDRKNQDWEVKRIIIEEGLC